MMAKGNVVTGMRPCNGPFFVLCFFLPKFKTGVKAWIPYLNVNNYTPAM